MNSKERVFTVLNGEIPDRVPIMEMWVDPRVFQVLYPGRSYEDFIEESDYYDAVCSFAGIVSPKINWFDREKRIFQDKWGALQQFTGEAIPLVINPPRINSEEDLLSYLPPDPADPEVLNSIRVMVERFKGKKAIAFVGEDVFAPSQYLRGGLENLLIDYKLNPSLVIKLAKIAEEYHIELYRKVIKEGVEIIFLGDDYAGKNGSFVSPVDFQRFILPGLGRIVQEIKKAGAYCIKHTDGNLWKIIDLIVGTGLDALGPLQESAGMDLALVKNRYNTNLHSKLEYTGANSKIEQGGKEEARRHTGCMPTKMTDETNDAISLKTNWYKGKISVMGGIEVDLLISGSPEEVIRSTEECLGRLSPGGRYIFSSANTITTGVKPENLKAMIDTAKAKGMY